jgi:hypothetical protein
MPVHFEYDVDGARLTSLDDIQDTEIHALVEEVQEELEAELGDVRCPEHGTEPTVVITPSGDEGFSIVVEGCCEQLATIVEDRIEEIYEVNEEDE